MTDRSNRWLPGFALVSLLALSGCAAAVSAPQDTAAPAPVSAPHWSYDDEDGPAHWSELSDDFTSCSAVTSQSPIDLPAAVPAPTEQITISNDERTVGEIADTGHTVQFTAEGGSPGLTSDDEQYELVQMHVHTPSEHTIAGVPAAAEFHFVHADEDGDLLVVGVLAREGVTNPAWQPFVDAASTATTDETEMDLDLSTLLPSSLDYYGYEGSLTTPPCSDGVDWVVLSTPVELSASQLGSLASVHEHNARPVQPLGDRTIVGGTGATVVD